MRLPWQQVGVFDRDTRTHRIERIPAPPEARSVFERSELGYEVRVGVELKATCPGCLEPMRFEWRRSYDEHTLDSARPYDDHEIMAVIVARDLHARVGPAERERDTAQRREAAAIARAEASEASFRRIQTLRSKRRAGKQRKRRSRNKGKR